MFPHVRCTGLEKYFFANRLRTGWGLGKLITYYLNLQRSKCNDIIAESSVNNQETEPRSEDIVVLQRVSGRQHHNRPSLITTIVLYSRQIIEQHLINIKIVLLHE